MNSRIKIKAYAKINLALDVLGKRKDGYHELDTVLQGINLNDLVEIEKAKSGIALSCDCPQLETGPGNLAYQAAEVMINNFTAVKGVRIHLQKRIPLAAGLAGGSTDAAAVLLGMNELFRLNLSREKLHELAAALGSDVPFCLFPLTVHALGRGEKLNELEPCPCLWMILLKPVLGVSTREVYGHLHKVTIKERPDIKGVIEALQNQDVHTLLKKMANVLEYVTFDLYPGLKKYVDILENLGVAKVMMSGSGPTLLAFQENEGAALNSAARLSASSCSVFISRTLGLQDLKERMMYFD